MTAHPERKPDALDLAEVLAIAASDIRAVASFVGVIGDATDEISDARAAAQRVLAALDAYEART